jgi:DNA polymerase-3 subunit epsilon
MFTNTTLNDSELFEAVSYYYSLRAARHIYMTSAAILSTIPATSLKFHTVHIIARVVYRLLFHEIKDADWVELEEKDFCNGKL